MLDVPLGCADRKIIPRSLELVVEPYRREARPPPCRSCCGPAWWNGWRVTYPVVTASADSVVRWELPLARAKCSCCRLGFTCYPPGFYPAGSTRWTSSQRGRCGRARRRVRHAGGCPKCGERDQRTAVVGVGHRAHRRRSVSRARRAHRLSTATVATPRPRSRTAAVLEAIELLGAALVRAGIAVVECTGLGRVLGWQHRSQGDVYGLVAGPRRLSPAMAPGGRPLSQ